VDAGERQLSGERARPPNALAIQFNISTQAGREALDLYLKTRFPPLGAAKIVGVMNLAGEGDYDRYQMPFLGTSAYSDRGWQKETRDEQGVTKEFGGEQVHQQDPTWLAELTGDRELYSSAQLISQQIRGKEKYTAIINIKSESGDYNREQFGKIFMGAKTSGPVTQSGAWTLSAEIDKKVVHELERVSTKFKDAKNRDDKQKDLEALRKELEQAKNLFITGYEKLKVSQDFELRKAVRGAGGHYKVIKNNIAAKASEGTPAEAVLSDLKGMCSLAYTSSDPVALAKALTTYAKANPAFVFRAGFVEGRAIDVKSITDLASMPSKEEILSKLLFLINAPAQRLVTAMNAVGRNLAVVIDQGCKENKFQQ